MDYEQILFERRDGVGLITLNRPDRLNAWTQRMSAELGDAIEHCNADPEVSTVVVTGAGRGFCAGADIRDGFAARLAGREEERRSPAAADWVGLIRRSKPMIAAVNGAAVGVGLTMILPFDVIVASEQARFGMFFIKMGLAPELASSHFAVQRVGFAQASEMCLSGRLYDAGEALRIGLVNRVVPAERLLEEALGVAREIGANPGPQLRMVKDLLTQNGAETDLREVQRREAETLRKCYETPEHREAVQAFLEKRPPDFRKPGS